MTTFAKLVEAAVREKFVVEKNILVPKKTGGGRAAKYPWAKMEPGDSFFVPGGDLNSLTSCAYGAFGRGNYALRTTEVSGVEGVRVWRTA